MWHLIRFMAADEAKTKLTVTARYYHGKGGGAPVTVGTIQTNRQAAYLDGVDIVVNGHNHHGYVLPRAKMRLTSRGIVERGVTLFLRTPGYKASMNQETGYDVEKGSPRANGAVLVRFGLHGKGSYGRRFYMRGETWIV